MVCLEKGKLVVLFWFWSCLFEAGSEENEGDASSLLRAQEMMD